MLMPSYWKQVLLQMTQSDEQRKATNRKKRSLTEKDIGDQDTNTVFSSANLEQNRVKEDEAKGIYCDGLRIIDLTKVYRKNPFDSKGKDVKAVSNVYLEVPKNELLCLLGHNGAGKSTLFNMLTGLVEPSMGFAKIVGLDIRSEQDAIRKVIGVVPQFDILWD